MISVEDYGCVIRHTRAEDALASSVKVLQQ